MNILGFRVPFTGKRKAVYPVDDRAGWRTIVGESYPGAWQQDVTINNDAVLANHAVFACQTLIASDISKLRIKLVEKDENGIWAETSKPAFSPVLRRPNHFQNRLQFLESWVLSKLQRGNAYILKERDRRGVVTSLYVLDPALVKPLVADNGSVYYELSGDKLSGLAGNSVVVPAKEIIHDRFNTFFHPLVGLSPIFAAGLAATHGLSIQTDSTLFFQNGAQPGGILTAPGAISDDTASRLKTYWDTNFTGKNRGKVAVLGDGLKYEAMKTKAVDAQLIEQLKWSAEVVCGVYHVPPFMAAIGAEPNYNNVQNLTLRYYSQCLQVLIEAIEACLDDGLGMDGFTIGAELETDELLRMDAQTQMDVLEKSKGKMTPNEQRKRLNLPPKVGGDTVYMQEQDHSLAWLAKRDALLIEAPARPNDDEIDTPPDDGSKAMLMRATLRKELGLTH